MGIGEAARAGAANVAQKNAAKAEQKKSRITLFTFSSSVFDTFYRSEVSNVFGIQE
jgi:hypothetical protein